MMKGYIILRAFPWIQALPLKSLDSQSAVKYYVRETGRGIAEAKTTGSAGDVGTDLMSYLSTCSYMVYSVFWLIF